VAFQPFVLFSAPGLISPAILFIFTDSKIKASNLLFMKKLLVVLSLCIVVVDSSAQRVLELMDRTDLTLQEIETRANRIFDSI
jgi:hypothetical protein